MKRATTMLLVVAILGLVTAPMAWAEDEPKGDSAAEQAFRDAWWAETSAGALDRALDGYRKASEAEGPAAVRARAMYRMAVVLERIGPTDEAIRALEKLAKDFPDEADLQAKARDRLEEWTAVDLRTNFEEWYERYKYSPEFQGRIVELVLALGASSGETGASNRAAEELLTIGQASLPALEAHLDSSNQTLRGRAVDLLLQLGTYPHARHLLETEDWGKMPRGWTALLAAPSEARTRLLSELDAAGAEGNTVETLRAVLNGPESWPRAVEIAANSQLNRAVIDAHPDESVLESLRGLVRRLEPRAAVGLAYSLLAGGHVPTSVALEWLELVEVRKQVATRMQGGEFANARTWRALVDAMNALPIDDSDQRTLFRALMRSLSDASVNEDLRPAVQAYERVAPSGSVHISASRTTATGASLGHSGILEDVDAVSRFLSQVVDEARDPTLAKRSMEDWARLHRGDEDVSDRLVAWTLEATDPLVARAGAKLAGQLATDRTLGGVIEALGERTPEIDGDLISGLRSNRRLLSLAWGDERILKLHAFAHTADGTPTSRDVGKLIAMLHRSPERLDQMTRLALKVPRRIWRGFTQMLQKDSVAILARAMDLAALRSEFQRKWPHWPLEDRIPALLFFGQLPVNFFGDEALLDFLRRQLGAQMAVRGEEKYEALERQTKEYILYNLPEVDLDDIRQVFDLSAPEGALAAWETGKLPLTSEVYDALAAARSSPDEDERFGFLNHWQQKAPAEIARRVLRQMVTDKVSHIRRVGIQQLATYRSRDDIRLFEAALNDEDDDVRFEAAEALAGVYDRAAIKALAEALDDPSPEVRDRILATLEKIREIEEKKDYWRRFAEGER